MAMWGLEAVPRENTYYSKKKAPGSSGEGSLQDTHTALGAALLKAGGARDSDTEIGLWEFSPHTESRDSSNTEHC